MKPSTSHHTLFACLAVLSALPPLRAWDYENHRIISQIALESLPADFPRFVHALSNAERVKFLAGEPDRWRNVPDLPLKQSGGSWTDHFCDMEYIPEAGLDWATVPSTNFPHDRRRTLDGQKYIQSV